MTIHIKTTSNDDLPKGIYFQDPRGRKHPKSQVTGAVSTTRKALSTPPALEAGLCDTIYDMGLIEGVT